MFKKLRDLTDNDVDNVGNKALNCAKMLLAGFNVPNGFVLYGELSDRDYANAEAFMCDILYYVVRSSMPDEDTVMSSNAGKYITEFNVTKKYLKNVVEYIYQSVKSNIHKCVLIQELIETEVSGVIFTKHPITYRGILINAVMGIGENLVSGIITPDEYILDGDCVKSKISPKYSVYTFGNLIKPGENIFLNNIRCRLVIANDRRELLSVYFKDKYKPCLSNTQILQLQNISNKLKEFFNCELDIEFGIYNNSIFILQARPITVILQHNTISQNSILKFSAKIVGSCASKGRFIGKIVKFDNDKQLNKKILFNEKMVIVVNDFLSAIIYNINNIGAILTARGGVLSHAAILCREKNIPCIVGIESQIDRLHNDMIVCVNADTGEVYLL